MLSQRIFAIVIGIFMLTSVAGFALSNVYTNQESNKPPEIPAIVEKVMEPQERVQVLQTGRTLIEYLYAEGCSDCKEKEALYRNFAKKYGRFLVLEIAEVPGNRTADRIIGMQGDAMDLSDVSDEEKLFEVFCSVAILQPQECILLEI